MHSSCRHAAPALLSLALALSAACSSSDEAASSDSPSQPIVAVSQIDLRSDVRQVDTMAWDAMLLPHQGRDLWLKPEARSAFGLDVGTVAVIKGRGVLKVKTIRVDGDHLVVEQGALAFQDFIENGTISIDGKTAFDTSYTDPESDIRVEVPESSAPAADPGGAQPASLRPASVSLHPLGDVLPPVDTTPAPIYSPPTGVGRSLIEGAKDFVLDGWHVQKQSLSTGDDSLHYDITLSKESGAFDAKIHLSGTVKGLATRFKVTVHDHVTAQQTFDVKTSGDAEMDWAVRISQGGTGYNKILAPGLSFKQQFFLGEIPMVLKVKSAVGIILGASGASTTTTGKVHLTYSSDGGVHITSSTADGQGTAASDLGFEGQQGTLATGPAAFGFVATLPRVDLGVGVDGLFVTGATFSNNVSSVVTARGAVALSPCADITTTMTGKVGLFVDVTESAAGQVIATGAQLAGGLLSRTVYEKKREDRTCGLNP